MQTRAGVLRVRSSGRLTPELQVLNTPEDHVTRDYREGLASLVDLEFMAVDTSGKCRQLSWAVTCADDSPPQHAGLEPFMSTDSIQGRATQLTEGVLQTCSVALMLYDGRYGTPRWQPVQAGDAAVTLVGAVRRGTLLLEMKSW